MQGALIPNQTKNRTVEPVPLFREIAAGSRVILLDVREEAEIERSRRRLPRSQNIPSHLLFVHRSELPERRSDPIVTVSTDGERARVAAFTLALLGYTNVRSLVGGVNAWARLNLPLV